MSSTNDNLMIKQCKLTGYVRIQLFEQDMVSVGSSWQGRLRAWVIDTPPQMDSLRLQAARSATQLQPPQRDHLFQSAYPE